MPGERYYIYLSRPACQIVDFYYYPASFFQVIAVALTLFILHLASEKGGMEKKVRDPRSVTRLSSFDDSARSISFDEHRASRNSWLLDPNTVDPNMAANAALVELQQPSSKDG